MSLNIDGIDVPTLPSPNSSLIDDVVTRMRLLRSALDRAYGSEIAAASFEEMVKHLPSTASRKLSVSLIVHPSLDHIVVTGIDYALINKTLHVNFANAGYGTGHLVHLIKGLRCCSTPSMGLKEAKDKVVALLDNHQSFSVQVDPEHYEVTLKELLACGFICH